MRKWFTSIEIRYIIDRSIIPQEVLIMNFLTHFFFSVYLKILLNNNPEYFLWFKELLPMLEKYEINTVERVAGFIAQTAHESGNYTITEENLNYSVQALLRVFPRYFGKANPEEFARNPVKLANYVYMDVNRTRSGRLGNIHPNDGWNFRGRGIIQITGRTSYTLFGNTISLSPEEVAEYLSTKKGSIESACWYWNSRSCNRFCDKRDIIGLSKAINGGKIGIDDRIHRWNTALDLFNSVPLSRGSNGVLVKNVQESLNLKGDGIFGRITEGSLIEYQTRNNLNPTGQINNETLKSLYSL
jgi:putative chitinase